MALLNLLDCMAFQHTATHPPFPSTLLIRLALWSVSFPRLPPSVPYTGTSPNKILVYLLLSWIIWTNTCDLRQVTSSFNLFPHLQNSVNNACCMEVI